MFRAFNTSSMFTASHLDALRYGTQLLAAMHEILQLACGFRIPKDNIHRYTEHSRRLFLNETGRARNEPPSCRHEVGRWSLPENKPWFQSKTCSWLRERDVD
jgi:hypothetical protein